MAEFDKVIAVKLRGVFLCAREAAIDVIGPRRRDHQRPVSRAPGM